MKHWFSDDKDMELSFHEYLDWNNGGEEEIINGNS